MLQPLFGWGRSPEPVASAPPSSTPQCAPRTDDEEDGEGDGAQTSCPQPPKGGSSVKRSNHGICRDVASLTRLPHPALERVASFSDGPSMYSLALTAKHPFFSDYFAVDSVRGTAFATRLLSIAVRGQLSRLVSRVGGAPQIDRYGARSESEQWVSAGLNMAKLDGILGAASTSVAPQALISGSIVVQALLGKEWSGSDIDIFCTQDAAAHVRGRLSSIARFGLSGFKLGEYCQDQQVRSLESNIEHVETWVTTPEETSPQWTESWRGTVAGGLEKSLADGQFMLNKRGHSYSIGAVDGESPIGRLPAFSFDLSIEPADCPLRCASPISARSLTVV